MTAPTYKHQPVPLSEFDLEGYTEREPGRDTADIDAGVAAECSCSACGRNGLEYRPYMQGSSYRAFAVCPTCGNASEF